MFAPEQSLPNPGTTFHQHALADALTPRGRFSAVETSYVVGSKPDISGAYPAASAAHQIQLPDEPPLGLDNPALDPQPMTTEGSGGDADAPLAPPDVEPAPPLSHDDPTGTHLPSRPAR